MTVRDRLRSPTFPRKTSAVIAVLVGVFVLQGMATPAACQGMAYPALCTATTFVRTLSPVGVLVAPLLHGSWAHILLNATIIGIFGGFFERYRGSSEYLLFLFATTTLGHTAQLIGAVAAGRGLPVVVGFSGASYALAGFAAAHGLASGAIRREDPLAAGRTLLAVVVVLAVVTLLTSPGGGQSATLTHAVGTGAGIAWGVGTGLSESP